MRFVHWSLGLGVLAALPLLYLEPPGGQGFYPGCGLYADHGLHCPGCGGLRARKNFALVCQSQSDLQL